MVLAPLEGRSRSLIRFDMERSLSFRIEEWEADMWSAPFLDTELFKGPDIHVTRRLSCRPKFKQTSLGVPLSPSSFHHPSVHRAWTRAELRRFARLSSSASEFEKAKQVFLKRLSSFHFSHEILTELNEYDPYFNAMARVSFGTVPKNQPKASRLVLVLPYGTGMLATGVQKVFSDFLNSDVRKEALRAVWPSFSFQSGLVAWKLTAQHLKDKVQSLCFPRKE